MAQLANADIPERRGRRLYRVREFRSAQELDEFLSGSEHPHRSDRRRLDTIGVRIDGSRSSPCR